MTAAGFDGDVVDDESLHFASCDLDETQRWLAARLQSKLSIGPKAPGPFEADIAVHAISNAKLVTSGFCHGAQIEAEITADNLIVYAIASGNSKICIGKKIHSLDKASGLILNKKAEKISASLEGDGLTFSVGYGEVALVLERYFERPVARDLDLCCSFAPETAEGPAIFALISAMEPCVLGRKSSPMPAPHAERMKRDALIMLILERFPHRYASWFEQSGAAASPGELGRAIEFIDSQRAMPLTVEDVANEVGISIRALQRGFRRYKGTSPHAYLKRARLAQVRLELLDPASTRSIAEIASHWGFSNRGHFALDYFRAFGEQPSQTRRSR